MKGENCERCIFCGWECAMYRTDNLRRHMKSCHPTPEDVSFEGGPAVKHPDNNQIVILKRKPGDAHIGYCFGCWHEIVNNGQNDVKNGGFIGFIDRRHFCKGPQERTPRTVRSKPTTVKATPAPAPVAPVPDRIVHVQEEPTGDIYKQVIDHFKQKKLPTLRTRIQYYVEEAEQDEEPDWEYTLQCIMNGGDPEEEQAMADKLQEAIKEKEWLFELNQTADEEHRTAMKKQKEHYEAKMKEKEAEMEAEIDIKRSAIQMLAEALAELTGRDTEKVISEVLDELAEQEATH
jgi:hypothetical protein